MIRATDDVERLRLFIGQGLVMALQALVLLVDALVILLLTSWQLMLVILPILPITIIMFSLCCTCAALSLVVFNSTP
jgi:ATP-binding cassette subfamily B multidrug efflux pump